MHGALRDNSRFLGAHIGPLNPDPYSDGRSLGLKDQPEATTVIPELQLLSERRRETGNERER